MADPSRLDEMMRSIAHSLSEPGDIEQALKRITHTAHATVPNVDCASISIRHHNGRLETIAPTHPGVTQVDCLQYQLNEGPCYDAVSAEEVIYCRDLHNDARWPTFGPRAAALGLLSQLAIGLAHPGGTYTALNLYSHDLYAFEDHRIIADVFASHAKVVLSYALEVQRLKDALMAGTTIGRATGIIMERQGIDADSSLEMLLELSRTNATDLADVAERVVRRARYEDNAAHHVTN